METLTDEAQLIWNYTATKEERAVGLSKFITNYVYRDERAVAVSTFVRQIHFQNWSSYLHKIYIDLKEQVHVVRRLADTPFTYTADEYYLSCLQANLFGLDSIYQMVPLPFKVRLILVLGWIRQKELFGIQSIFFLIRFAAGKC